MTEFYIRTKRLSTPTNAKRIFSREDVPEDIWMTNVVIFNNKVVAQGAEGAKEGPLGSVVCYQTSTRPYRKFDAWIVENPNLSLVEKNGVFYKKPPILKACIVPKEGEDIPNWLKGCHIAYSGSITTIQTLRGIANAKPGVDTIVFYGMNQCGKHPKVNIIRKGSTSCSRYILCEETGEDIGSFDKYYPA